MTFGSFILHVRTRLSYIFRRGRGKYYLIGSIAAMFLLYIFSQFLSSLPPDTDSPSGLSKPPLTNAEKMAQMIKDQREQEEREKHQQETEVAVPPIVRPVKTPEELKQLQQRVDSYDPRTSVAFAIPVGGRTERAKQMSDIVRTLLDGGAPASTIFIMEDVEGRPGKVNNPQVAAAAKELGVRVFNSHVSRVDMPEDHTNFGIHLARHYKFMLDFLLVSPEAAKAQGEELSFKRDAEATPFDFLCIIEDDLVLAPDFVKYFYAMSRVMKVDDSLYCVSAHQDNAFYGTAYEPEPGSVVALDPLGFDFRRGNHFMAPGWMTSREIYTSIVRPKWLDENGQYAYKQSLHLRNGHWDRFFDSLIGKKDCIFPEIPRIIHQGADGFTVDQKAQMELYSNLQLSKLPIEVDYGNLNRMTLDGYIDSSIEFIRSAIRLTSLEEARLYRNAKLVYIVHARSDQDELWNSIINGFFGVIGVGGYGGYEGYVKVRGIFSGAVFERWITNLIMLVGEYSPYLSEAKKLQPKLKLNLVNLGCFNDRPGMDRDLPVYIPYYKPALLSPSKCLSTCLHLGYKYAGLQAGMECWCGDSYGKHGEVHDDSTGSKCAATCGFPEEETQLGFATTQCGGDWKNSIYTSADPQQHEQSLIAPEDTVWLAGKPRQSCTEACQEASSSLRKLQCAESLFPLLHRHCSILKSLIGCDTCVEEEDMTKGVYSPGGFPEGGACALSKGRYIRCSAKPEYNYRRACVCKIKGGLTVATRP